MSRCARVSRGAAGRGFQEEQRVCGIAGAVTREQLRHRSTRKAAGEDEAMNAKRFCCDVITDLVDGEESSIFVLDLLILSYVMNIHSNHF